MEWDIDQMVKKSSKVKKVFIFGIWLIQAGFAFVAAIILLKLRMWPFELFHHFVLHYLLLTVPLIVLCLFLRAKKEVALFSALFFIFGISLWGAYGAPRVSQDQTAKPLNNHQELTLISHNVKDSNQHHQKLGLWLQSQPADVVLLQEVPSRIAAWYKEERFYPYQLEVYDPALNHPNFPDDKAIVILSKYLISEDLEFKPSKDSRPVPLVRIDIPDAQGPWIAVIDALEPKTAKQLGRRDQLLLESAKKISEQNGPIVVAGDFNATPLTPIFQDFLKTAALSAPRFYNPTFPSKLKWLGIPIDHILVRNIKVKSIEALPAIGSDHRPLKAALVMSR